MLITASQLHEIMPTLPSGQLAIYLPLLNAVLEEFEINTPVRIAAFLAQTAHESGQFRYLEEIASGAAYEGRKDLGNTQPGDGKRFKGRGIIQLTGRSNYQRAGAELGVDLVLQPQLAAKPELAFRVAGLFWQWKKLNEWADKNSEGAFKVITRRINGGLNGYAQRKYYWGKAKAVLMPPVTGATGTNG